MTEVNEKAARGVADQNTMVAKVGTRSLYSRRIRMLCEMGWLTLAMTISLFIYGKPGYMIGLLMLMMYVLVYRARVARCSSLVWMLAIGLALGAIGGLSTDSVKNIYEPLLMGFSALAVMGGFVTKYNRHEDTMLLGAILALLMPVAIWQSVQRNDLLFLWGVGSRKGVNLIALFLMIGASYCFLLKDKWKIVAVPFYIGLYLLGSRTGFITSLAFPVIFCALNPKSRAYLLKNSVLLSIVLGCLIFSIWYWDLLAEPGLKSAAPIGTQRFEGGAISQGATQRIDLNLLWLKYLWTNPTLFGNGIDTYGIHFGGDTFPHNGFLHVFNGLGIISGILYLVVCIRVLQVILPRSLIIPVHIVWAVTFFLSMILRSFGEAQVLVSSVHIAGFAVTYATGLTIWAAERIRIKAVRRKRVRFLL
jgi:hypothetical protein